MALSEPLLENKGGHPPVVDLDTAVQVLVCMGVVSGVARYIATRVCVALGCGWGTLGVMARTVVSDEQVAGIREAHAEGLSCRQAARRVGLSLSCVARRAQLMGLAWHRSPQVAAATERSRVDARRLRSEANERSIVLVLDTMSKITAPYTEWGFSQSKAQWVAIEHAEPPSRNAADYARTCRELMSVHRESFLLDHEGELIDQGKSVLGDLCVSLGVKAAELQPGGCRQHPVAEGVAGQCAG